MYDFLDLLPIPQEEQRDFFLFFILFSLSHLTLGKRNRKLLENKSWSGSLGAHWA